jgi:RNA polymerase sigma-70 factor, ECF subfamily
MSAHTAVDQIFRAEQGRVLAALISQLEVTELAEDALQDALILALRQWQSGVPQNPGAWLTAVAKRRLIDRLRRSSTFTRKQADIHAAVTPDTDDGDADEPAFPDERLKLIFTYCHPSLTLEAQVALTRCRLMKPSAFHENRSRVNECDTWTLSL